MLKLLYQIETFKRSIFLWRVGLYGGDASSGGPDETVEDRLEIVHVVADEAKLSESSELALGEWLEAFGGLCLGFLSVWESSLVEGSPLTAKVFNVVDGEDNLGKLF